MYKVVFTQESYQSINQYIEIYRTYFKNLYIDSGLWQENQIIESYILESQYRYNAIIDSIVQKLSDSFIHYENNQIVIFWKSKILLVKYQEKENVRIVTNIEIR